MKSARYLAGVLLIAAVSLTSVATGNDGPQNEDLWRQRALQTHREAANAQARYDAVMAEYSRLRAKQRDRGARKVDVLVKKQQAEEALRIANEKLAALPEEARRAGVPPGWVRVFPEDL